MATNHRAAIVLSFIAVSSIGVACGGVPGEDPIEDQESANTSDGGPDASVDARARDAGARDASRDGSRDGASSSDAGACSSIAPGPLQPQLVGQPFSGSEDFAFDGQGHIVGKRGNSIVLVGATPGVGSTTLASLPGQTYGLRYHPNGNLIAAVPGAGKLVTVTPSGQVTDLLTGLGQPNGVYVDFDGNIWITEFSGNKVLRLAPDGTRSAIVSGTANAQAANGVALDAAKKILFYTEYSKGKINRIAADSPSATPIAVATIPGAALDGIVLDACGNVYALDQGSSRIFRVRIDASGNAAAAPELLATFPTNVANAQFGAGAGFDAKTLYVTGNPGSVYALQVGVGGAPVPQPPAP